MVAQIRRKLNLRGGLRAVGDRKATIRRVLLLPGSMQPPVMWQRYTEADLIIAGEVREWENTHYRRRHLHRRREARVWSPSAAWPRKTPACASAPPGLRQW